MNAGGIDGTQSQGVHGTQSTRGVNGAEAREVKLSIADLTHLTMLERSELLEHDMRGQLEQMQQDNSELRQLSDIQAKLADMRTNTSSIDSPTWTVDRNASPTEIALDNGYVLEIPGDREEWVIRDANGNETRVWGDPHVDEGDLDGNKNWELFSRQYLYSGRWDKDPCGNHRQGEVQWKTWSVHGFTHNYQG